MKKFKKITSVIIAIVTVTSLFAASAAFAAPLNYTANATITLTSPAINYTIQSGSAADSVVVNAGNIVVAISGANTFTMVSPTRDIVVTVNSSSGTISQSVNCNGSTQSVVTILSSTGGSGNFTLTPAAGLTCGGATAPLTSGGGGGGGGYSAPAALITSFTASPLSITSGQSSTLSWVTNGAVSLSISPTVGSVVANQTGSVTVTPIATTTYILTATGPSNSSTATATVTVPGTTPVNPPTSAPTPAATPTSTPAPTPSPTPIPTGTPTPVPSPVPPVSGIHPDGTLILSSGTISLVQNGQAFGFRNPQEYKSWGFSFSQAVKANAADASLPNGGVLKAFDGTLVLDASDNKTMYVVAGGQKTGFANYPAFKGLGYKLGKALKINLSDYPVSSSVITSASNQHPNGSLVSSAGTTYWIMNGQLLPFTSSVVFNSYGFSSGNVLKANAADLALPQGPAVLLRDGTLCRDSSSLTPSYFIISDGQKKPFGSLAALKAAGYKSSNIIKFNLSGYQQGSVAF